MLTVKITLSGRSRHAWRNELNKWQKWRRKIKWNEEKKPKTNKSHEEEGNAENIRRWNERKKKKQEMKHTCHFCNDSDKLWRPSFPSLSTILDCTRKFLYSFEHLCFNTSFIIWSLNAFVKIVCFWNGNKMICCSFYCSLMRMTNIIVRRQKIGFTRKMLGVKSIKWRMKLYKKQMNKCNIFLFSFIQLHFRKLLHHFLFENFV